jgi:hypothetical protein
MGISKFCSRTAPATVEERGLDPRRNARRAAKCSSVYQDAARTTACIMTGKRAIGHWAKGLYACVTFAHVSPRPVVCAAIARLRRGVRSISLIRLDAPGLRAAKGVSRVVGSTSHGEPCRNMPGVRPSDARRGGGRLWRVAQHARCKRDVGAGRAGLAAAVYAASEGLQTIVIEGAGRPRRGAGAEVRRAALDLTKCRLHRLQPASVSTAPRGRSHRASARW